MPIETVAQGFRKVWDLPFVQSSPTAQKALSLTVALIAKDYATCDDSFDKAQFCVNCGIFKP